MLILQTLYLNFVTFYLLGLICAEKFINLYDLCDKSSLILTLLGTIYIQVMLYFIQKKHNHRHVIIVDGNKSTILASLIFNWCNIKTILYSSRKF